jgi:hypothetical protein
VRIAAAILLLLLPSVTGARPLRPRFESSDLELERPGTVELNLQVGFIQSDGPYRVVVPDLEVDVGIFDWLELDVDWTYALEQPFDHSSPDNVWLSLKLGLLDVRDARREATWALGLQLGPRLGAAPGASGAGFESLLLVAHQRRRVHLVLNVGGLADPPIAAAPGITYRPIAFEFGGRVEIDCDARGLVSVAGEVDAVAYLSIDPSQIALSGAVNWNPTERISLSLTGMVGFLSGGDRWGVLLGYSQKLVSAAALAR